MTKLQNYGQGQNAIGSDNLAGTREIPAWLPPKLLAGNRFNLEQGLVTSNIYTILLVRTSM